MPEPLEQRLHDLRRLARSVAERSYVPYSLRPTGVALLLSDGLWVPGVRVESASFSLTIPALLNAFTTAVAAGRPDVEAVVQSRPFEEGERAFIAHPPAGAFDLVAEDAFVIEDVVKLSEDYGLLAPFLDAGPPETPEAGVRMAHEVAARAFIPASNFPVGCVLELTDGRLVPGVNVEHPDWLRILCAERNALGTAVSYGLSGFRNMYLSCPKDPLGSPCGACRQLLVEQASELSVWMDRGDAPPDSAAPDDLLPGSFTGRALQTPGTAEAGA